ncbi:MAG: hypothetical protein WCT07_00765 [Candidatus Paceibacterota bacterium]|jgi:type II secretory pathway pseudopilin PulG
MISLFNKKIKGPIRAFTLIETLVSIIIITTVILGPLMVASNASAYARQTKDSMIALYLAQEAVELLHHQQDSLYLRCIGQSNLTCIPQDNETQSEAAWRIFRERLSNNVQGATCYGTNNTTGCAYDFIDMTKDEDFNPSKYDISSNMCNTLSLSPGHFYVCTGAHAQSDYTITPFSRSVFITSIPTLTGADENYNDDLRVTVTVTFKRATGYIRQIKVIDFMHARA